MSDPRPLFSKDPQSETYEYNEPTDPNFVVRVQRNGTGRWSATVSTYGAAAKVTQRRTKVAAMLEGLKMLELLMYKISLEP